MTLLAVFSLLSCVCSIRGPRVWLYSTQEELRCFRFQPSSPKRERGRASTPSLTLRATFEITCVQDKRAV
jgi:hypothetical protein